MDGWDTFSTRFGKGRQRFAGKGKMSGQTLARRPCCLAFFLSNGPTITCVHFSQATHHRLQLSTLCFTWSHCISPKPLCFHCQASTLCFTLSPSRFLIVVVFSQAVVFCCSKCSIALFVFFCYSMLWFPWFPCFHAAVVSLSLSRQFGILAKLAKYLGSELILDSGNLIALLGAGFEFEFPFACNNDMATTVFLCVLHYNATKRLSERLKAGLGGRLKVGAMILNST